MININMYFSLSIYLCVCVCVSVCVRVLSHVWLYRLINCGPLGSSVHGIFQAKLLRWFVISFSSISHTYTHTCVCVFIFKMCVGFFAEYSNCIVQFDPLWNLCSLIEEFRLLTFKWIIYATGLICTISVTVFYLLTLFFVPIFVVCCFSVFCGLIEHF